MQIWNLNLEEQTLSQFETIEIVIEWMGSILIPYIFTFMFTKGWTKLVHVFIPCRLKNHMTFYVVKTQNRPE